jgi:septal ring factor EnvC (AmiA/AmiB activator)
MGNTGQQELFDQLRSSGMRKKVAKALSKSAGKSEQKRSEALSSAAERLREVAAALDKRGADPRRRDAAKKAARTRKRNAHKRSAAARRGAETRAKAR